MSCDLEFRFKTIPRGRYCSLYPAYCSLYPDVLQLIPGGTAAYIVTCDFNENPKSDFNFDLGFVNSPRNSIETQTSCSSITSVRNLEKCADVILECSLTAQQK